MAAAGSVDAAGGVAVLDIPFAELLFAVADVETTGLDPARDEIIEIAVVRMSGAGVIDGELSSLVNIAGEPRAQTVHGIDGERLRGAPAFGEIAGQVRASLYGAIVTGHNAAFDREFLGASLRRSGLGLPEVPYVCTMDLAVLLGIDEGRHRLARACAAQGIALSRPHSALSDARATAALLARYLRHAEHRGHGSLRTLSDDSVRCCGTWGAGLSLPNEPAELGR